MSKPGLKLREFRGRPGREGGRAFSKFLDPLNEIAIRRIFGSEENKDILIQFLHDVLGFTEVNPIQDVEFLEPNPDFDITVKKQSIVDVLCKDSTGARYIFQISVAKYEGLESGGQFYAAKTYSRLASERYHDVKEVISIVIADCVFFPEKPGYKSDRVVLDSESFKQELRDFSFTFIELPKFSKTEDDKLENNVEKWCYVFKHADEIKDNEIRKLTDGNIMIKKAFKELKKFNWSYEEYRAYERETERSLYEIAAVKERILKVKMEIAEKLVDCGLSMDVVARATGLTRDQIEKLRV